MIEVVIYLIFDMSATLTQKNIDTINLEQGTNYPYGVTFQNLYNSRGDINSQRGYFKNKDGSFYCWVLPYVKGAISLDGLSPNTIIEVSEQEYLDNWIPLFDKEEFDL